MAIKDQTDAFLSNPRCVGSYNEIIVKCNEPTAVWQNERTDLFNFLGTHSYSKRKKNCLSESCHLRVLISYHSGILMVG